MTLSTDRQHEIVEAVRAARADVSAAYNAESLTTDDIIGYLTAESWYDSCGTAEDGRNEHEVWLETAPAAEIADWIDLDELMTTRCIYCDAEVQRTSESVAPDAEDDAAWAAAATVHAQGCKWVETRAHRWTRVLSAGAAAEILGVTRRTVLNYRGSGLLVGSYLTPGGDLRVPEATAQRLRLGHLPIRRAYERHVVAGVGRNESWLDLLGDGTARDESDRLYWVVDDWAVPQRS